jgi:hypothetical protein
MSLLDPGQGSAISIISPFDSYGCIVGIAMMKGLWVNGDIEHENHRYTQLDVSRVLWFGITVVTYYIGFYEEFDPVL